MSDESSERHDDSRVMDGIFYILRSGATWRGLPDRYGPPTTYFNRYNHWHKDGTWSEIFGKLQRLLDSGDAPIGGAAALRVHKHGAGSRNNGVLIEIGPSRDRPMTRIHAAGDGRGSPQARQLPSEQAADCTLSALARQGLSPHPSTRCPT